jgi:hypothetical protein
MPTPTCTRISVLVACVTGVMLACAPPAAAQYARLGAVPGQMVAAPRADGFAKRLPVRVAVRVPARTARLQILLDRRDITSRFRGVGGSRRVAHLTRGDGLRYGWNRLIVRAVRSRGRPVIHARSFVLARRHDGLVRMRIRSGPVTSLNARVTGSRIGRLSVIRRSRTVRLWVNGRPATRALDRSRLTRFTARLSASQGLRYGVNRLRLLVAEPDLGRYAVVRRRFVLRRNRHLPAAGWDIDTHPRRVLRLNGRNSRTAGGGQPLHRWRIVRKPRGSRVTLRRAGSARPILTPDRPGHYVIRLTVRERSRRASASQGNPGGTDLMDVTVDPPSPLIPFKGITTQNGQHGIQVGGTFYPNKSPNGTAMQWLTLDRETLTLSEDGDNNWLDGTGSGAHGIQALTSSLRNTKQLVILSFPYGSPSPPVQPDQNDAFNGAMKTIGVGPIGANILQDRNKLAVIGVPKGGDGSGWYTHGGGNVEGLTGWLMPDRVSGFRFQAARPTFDTQASHTDTTNTMTLAGQRVDGALPAGATGGFQVATLDPIDFTVVSHAVFATNGVADPVGGINAMTDFLTKVIGRPHVVVQSIGRVGRPPPPSDPYQPDPGAEAWTRLGQALAGYGANPHNFFSANGSYAFVGGSWLERAQVAESNTAVVTDPTTRPQTTQAGTLSGRLTIRPDGYYVPVVADPSDKLQFGLYDMVFTDPKPWPYTREAGASKADAAAYKSALAYITGCLPDTQQGYGGNLRLAYPDLTRDWSTTKTDLDRMPYPADGRCATGSGVDRRWGFSRDQFEDLRDRLQLEFTWLHDIKNLFEAYEKTLNRTGAKNQVDLHSLGTAIHNDVDPPNEDLTADIGNFILQLMEAAALFITVPEGGAPLELAAIEAIAASYELGMSLTTDARTGAPAGAAVDSEVDKLSQDAADKLYSAATSLDSLRQVIITDSGRLEAVGRASTTPQWEINTERLGNYLSLSANAYFSNELFPVAYADEREAYSAAKDGRAERRRESRRRSPRRSMGREQPGGT